MEEDLEIPFRVRRTRRLNFGWDTERPESMSDIFDQRPLPICAVVAVLDSISINIALRRRAAPIPLSRQEIIDCLPHVNGLVPRPAVPRLQYDPDPQERPVIQGIYIVPRRMIYSYVQSYGVSLAVDYPDLGRRGYRRNPPRFTRKVRIQGFRQIPRGTSLSVIKRIINKHGTITACLKVYESFRRHRRGVYTGRQGPDDRYVGRHAVVVSGYGRKTHGPQVGTDFFKIKNSSGEEWGKRGYGKIQCRLLFQLIYAIIVMNWRE